MQVTTPFGTALAVVACLIGAALLVRPDSARLQRALVAVFGLIVVTGLTVGL